MCTRILAWTKAGRSVEKVALLLAIRRDGCGQCIAKSRAEMAKAIGALDGTNALAVSLGARIVDDTKPGCIPVFLYGVDLDVPVHDVLWIKRMIRRTYTNGC